MTGNDRASHVRGWSRRPLGLLIALVMVASLAAPAGVANAIIGASSNPPSTAAPDLRTAQVVDVNQKEVRACFDQPVANFAGNAALFHIHGYNDDVIADGTSLGVDPDPDCLLVKFAGSGSLVTQYTVLTVEAAAVSHAASAATTNIEGATALTSISLGAGGLSGRNTGPNVTSAAKDPAPGSNDVLFNHDEILDPGTCVLANFRAWYSDGTSAPAVGCVILPDSSTARVTFATTTNAVHFAELPGAVMDRGEDAGANKDPNQLGSNTGTLACVAPAVDAPNCTADLTAVSRINDQNVDYTFDKGGGPTGAGGCDPADFFVFDEDSTQRTAATCNVQTSTAAQTVVRATFPATANFSPFETPSAGVRATALMGGGAPTNTDGGLQLGTSQEASGLTDAPDLEDADFDDIFFNVTFRLDENVDPATVTTPGDFWVFDNNASKTLGTGFVMPISGNQITVNFPAAAINTAVGAGMDPDAARDFAGNMNTRAAVGRGPAPSAGTVQFDSSVYSVNEGGSATITVSRTGGSSGPASVNYSTSNGTASNADYTNVAGTLNWANGESGTKSFNVPITDDLLGEGNETVNLGLSGATGAALGSPSAATLTIIDNDSTGALSFSSTAYSSGEGSGSALITVNRTGGTSGTATVQYSTSNGSATAGSDYTGVSGTLTFGNGVSSQTFTVPITQDTFVEGNETVNLSLFSPGGGASLTNPTTAVLTIVDDDTSLPGTLAFASATHTVGESAGSQTVTVNRTGGSTGTVTVGYSTVAGSATAGSDYTVTTGTLSFGPGETSKTFLVPILNDAINESTESFSVVLSNATGGATLGAPSTAAVSITDDDPAAPGNVVSDLSIRYQNRTNRFKGRVSVPVAGTDEIRNICRNNREVLLRKNNGRLRGTFFTGPDGKWNVFKLNPNGGWYAVVLATGPRTLSNGSQVVCTRGESRVIFP